MRPHFDRRGFGFCANGENPVASRVLLVWLLLASSLVGCNPAPEIGFRSGSPLDDLPEWISPLLASGLRPD